MAKPLAVLLVLIIFLFQGMTLVFGKNCKFNKRYACGIEDCNCRYVNQNGGSISGLLKRFNALFTHVSHVEDQVCDKCQIFCTEEKHINCQHGSCDKKKGCICRDCWSGETCSKYHNSQPLLKQTLYFGHVKKDVDIGYEIVTVSAVDDDLETCADKFNCPCGRIKYSIFKGNELGLFHIHPDSGVVSLVKKPYDHHEVISITILAKNDEYSLNKEEETDKNKATVVITFQSDEFRANVARERRSLHHRTRRSVASYSALEITFEATTNQTFFPSDSSIDYRLYVKQNSSASPEQLNNISILLKSDNLKLPSKKSGYSVNISNSIQTIGSFEHSENKNVKFTVPNHISASDSQAYMEIKFNTIVQAALNPLALLQVTFIMNATTSSSVPVTFGPKYSNEIYTTYPKITLRRTTSGDVKVESALDYKINISMPFFNFTFLLEISTVVNAFRFLSIENVTRGEISDTIKAQHSSPTPKIYTGVNDNINGRVILDFGSIKVLNTDQNHNTMKLSFSVKVNDHHLLANNSIHWVGLGAQSGDEMLWVGQDAITISKNEPYLLAEIKAVNNTDSIRNYINDVLVFSWTVKHSINGSYGSANDVKVIFTLSPYLEWLTDSGFRNRGSTKDDTNAKGSKVITFTFTENGGVLNPGASIAGTIVTKVKSNVKPLSDLNIAIKIDYKSSANEIRPVRTYKPVPGYLSGVPKFNLSSNVQDNLIRIGQLVIITVKVVVNKMTLNGKFHIMLPIVSNNSVMQFVRHESFQRQSRHIGSNVRVTQKFMNAVAMFNSSLNNTFYHDTAEIDFGAVEINDLKESALSSVENNTMSFNFVVVLKDNDFVTNRSNYKIAIGARGSNSMVWIGQLIFIADVPLNRRPMLQIVANTNDTDRLTQGSTVTYNFTISHKEMSTALAFDIDVVWLIPPYTKFLGVDETSHEKITFTAEKNVIFKVSHLDFGEIMKISFSILLDPYKTLKKSGESYAVTPVALSYKNKQKNIYYEPLLSVAIKFSVPEKPIKKPKNAVAEFYSQGFIIDNSSSAIYVCSVSSKRNKPSCFWTNTKGATWKAVDVMVISIIGIDSTNNILYGVGNNMLSYMKYTSKKKRWYAVSNKEWENAKDNLYKDVVSVTGNDVDSDQPEIEKQRNVENGEKWGATKSGVFHYSSQNPGWRRKAFWNCCN